MIMVMELGVHNFIFIAFLVFSVSVVPAIGQNLLSCKTTSPDASGYQCNGKESHDHCKTFAIFRTNSYFSSLYNLSLYLGLDRVLIAEANGLSADTELLPKDQPLLIPIECKCDGGFFQAEVTKITIQGESFYDIAESLEGLTTCKAIWDKNPGIIPVNLADKVPLVVPLRCCCPSTAEISSGTRLLLTYPVKHGDKISNLSNRFNTSLEAIVFANNRSLAAFKPASLVPLTSILIPVFGDPSAAKPSEPNLFFPESSIPVTVHRHKKRKMWTIGIYIAVSGAVVLVSIVIGAAFLVIQLLKKKKQYSIKEADLELQQPGVSIRTISEKKVSFEQSLEAFDGKIINTTPRNTLVEAYSFEELRKATEDFSPSNQIEGSVYFGRLNGKDLAIKQLQPKTMSKVEFSLFQGATHHHPNIIRLLGTCFQEGSDPFLVFEFAKNGSLKDWLHGGLAIKNQFISSCYRFLTWKQRLKICLDVAVALQYMHQIMSPSYVHRNVKSRNIFLDDDFNAKVGNFGMGKCADDEVKDKEFISTNPAFWSHGYLAPEYIHQGVVSPTVDIFAYGVILLEVLSGKTPITRPDKNGDGCISLSEKIKSIMLSKNANELKEWMDSALGDGYSFDAAVALANLARACVDDDPSLRPDAAEIVNKLSRMVVEPAEHALASESSSKPLVKAVTINL